MTAAPGSGCQLAPSLLMLVFSLLNFASLTSGLGGLLCALCGKTNCFSLWICPALFLISTLPALAHSFEVFHTAFKILFSYCWLPDSILLLQVWGAQDSHFYYSCDSILPPPSWFQPTSSPFCCHLTSQKIWLAIVIGSAEIWLLMGLGQKNWPQVNQECAWSV